MRDRAGRVQPAGDEPAPAGPHPADGAEPAGDPEQVEIPLTSTATVNPDGTVIRNESTWVLLEVVYFAVPQLNYQGNRGHRLSEK